jgi:hypothetical protein
MNVPQYLLVAALFFAIVFLGFYQLVLIPRLWVWIIIVVITSLTVALHLTT